MSHEYSRKVYYSRDRERERERDRDRDRDREWNRNDYHYEKRRSPVRKRSRSPPPRENKRRSRSPRKHDKDVLDENILSEISKLPEPSELWESQVQEGGFSAPPAPTFPQEGTNYGGNYNQSYSGVYNDFPSVVPTAPHPPDMASWNQMSLPPPPAAPVYNVEEQIKKEAAIETEMRHQKAALSKQREDYIKKAGILKKELDTLKDQRNELRGDAKRSPSPDTKRFLKENTKLQLEIQNKLKTINNVVDMLNGIIGEEAQEVIESDDDTERAKRKSRSPSGKKFNYVYYDPEMHWCRVCNEFPPTAKDYLNHLHSPAHHKMAAAHMEAPWHSVAGAHEGFPSYAAAPTKRTPIRGLQFFVPSTAWYCKLCDQFIGDLHCASAHLKSIAHSKNYTNFVEQNPHWETDWMSDRQKAFEKARAHNKNKQIEDKPQYAAHTITFNKDGFHTKLKMESPPPPNEEKKKKKDKKKKNKRKRSSSSSSSSSSSGSDSEPKKKKKSKKSKKYSSNDKLSEWMSSIQMERLNDNDRKLLDNIKTRIKLDKMETSRRSSERERDRSSASQQRVREQERRESRARDERDRRDEPRRREERRDERRDERREERRDERRDDRRDEHREERRDERREERRDERRDERREERRDSSRRSPQSQDAKKPDIRKMPFIGKMPVYKNLAKTTKPEEKKEDESKKKEEDEASKKRREEMDAEIQKKVAEFKQKIASAQLERQQAELAPPLLLPLPHFLPPAMPPAQPPPPATTAPPANLPKDFQDALDIIFPSEVKNAEMAQAQQELFQGLPPGMAPPGFPGIPGLGGVMQPFPQLSILGNPPHMMMGFDMNSQLFQPRPQLYDTHVPILPNQKSRQNQNKNRQQKNNKENQKQNQNTNNVTSAVETTPTTTTTESTADSTKAKQASAPSTKNKEELDDLAMLGIDASDVGAGI